MKKKLLSLVLLGFLCSIGNVWGADYTIFQATSSGTNTADVTNTGVSVTFKSMKQTSNSPVTSVANATYGIEADLKAPRFGGSGNGNYIKITISENYTATITAYVQVSTASQTMYIRQSSESGTALTTVSCASTETVYEVKKSNVEAGDYYIKASSDKVGLIKLMVTVQPAADETAPTFSLSTPSTTSDVAITTSTVVLTASEAITKVGDNVSGTLKIGSADAVTINYVYDGTENTLTYTIGDDLTYSTTYSFTVSASQVEDAAGNENEETSAFSFTTEADVPAALTSVTPDGGSVNGNTSVNVVAIGTVKYLWSESSTANKSDLGWADGASITVPNVAGIRYLHLYAYKRADNQSDITTKTFSVTKVSSSVVKEWDFTQALSSTDNTNLTADSKWSSSNIDGGTRWTGANEKWTDKNTYIALTANDANIALVEGLLFARTSELKGTFFRLDDGQRFQLNGNNGLIKIPSLNAGDVIEVRFASAGGSAGDRKLTASSNCSLASAEGSNVSNINTDFKAPQFIVTENGDAVLTNPDNGLNFFYIKVYRTTPVVDVSISEYEWATFVSDQKLNFSLSGVDAYIITGHIGSAISKTKVTTVAANTPLLLNAAEGEYNIPVAASGTDYTASNLLIAGTGSAISAEEGKTKYVLGISISEAAEFQKIVDTPATVAVGKAYLQFNEVIAGAPSALRITDEENNATNLQSVDSTNNAVKFIENGRILILRDGITYDALGRIVK